MADAQKVIATAGLISVGVGSGNSILKYHKPPSSRFLIGSGLAYFLLSALAETEAGAEVAKGLALGIMTTILLGDGGGLLSYFAGTKEQNTTKPQEDSKGATGGGRGRPQVHRVQGTQPGRQSFRPDHLPAFPGIPSTH